MHSESHAAALRHAPTSHLANPTSASEVEVQNCAVPILLPNFEAILQVASKFLSKAAEEEGIRIQVSFCLMIRT